ncbi:hypothetical protein OEZ86_005866 [Tetradesmus obliquus]|nr:hypothetical protein OEZ86_005866 [Tetradesmus obliquus]
MGLASKLQAGGAGGGMMGGPPPGGAPMQGAGMPGTQPGAPPMPVFPPGPGGPSAPPAPYGQQPGAPGGAPSPYPPGAFGAYPGGAAPGGPAAAPMPGAPGMPPYGQPGQPGMPGGQQQQQQPGGFPGQHPPGGFGGPPQQGFLPPSGQPGMPGGPPSGMPMMQQQQQQQGMMMGAPGAPAGGAGGAPGGMAGAIHAKLAQIVAANQLQRFYPPQALQAVAARLDARVNFRDLAARWRMPVELALDLASLALYDVILFADDSGSMAFEENGERIDDLKLIGSKVAEIATLFDDDGILVRFMNSPTEGNGVRSAADVNALLAGVQYAGLTPLATALQSKVLAPIVFSLAGSGQLAKPVLVLTITDGEPTDNPRDLVVQVIKDARNRLAAQYGPKAVAFEFAQVGKDTRAQAFLGQLDKHPAVGGSIDCTSYFEMEQAEYQKRGINLSPELWLVKMMVGSIDPTYDEGDE